MIFDYVHVHGKLVFDSVRNKNGLFCDFNRYQLTTVASMVKVCKRTDLNRISDTSEHIFCDRFLFSE